MTTKNIDVSVDIDLPALQHNLQRVRTLAPQSKVMCMVKANAYGHGLLRCAKALSSADALGVARYSEALFLRKSGIQTPIVIMGGVASLHDMRVAMQQACDVVIHDQHQLEWFLSAAIVPSRCWVKINTGMSRLGFFPEEIQRVYAKLAALFPALELVWMTHLACADEPEHPLNQAQIQCFKQTIAGLPGKKSIVASAGIVAFPDQQLDWVRPGLMLYGVSPFVSPSAEQLGLKPVMTVSAPVISVYECPVGATIGYGATYRCTRPTRVAVIAMGYGDGYPRAAVGTSVWLHQRLCLLIGRVSMDMITVDVTDLPEVKRGEFAVLWGAHLPVETVAANSHTSAYELLTRLSPRSSSGL